MAMRKREIVFSFMVLLWFWSPMAINGLLSPKGVNYEGKIRKVSFVSVIISYVCKWR